MAVPQVLTGANQLLPATQRDNQSTLGPRGNKVQSGRVPRAESGPVGANTAAKPAGLLKPIND